MMNEVDAALSSLPAIQNGHQVSILKSITHFTNHGNLPYLKARDQGKEI